jgi:hypothetical protein
MKRTSQIYLWRAFLAGARQRLFLNFGFLISFDLSTTNALLCTLYLKLVLISIYLVFFMNFFP